MKSRVVFLLLLGIVAAATVFRPAIDRALFVIQLSIDNPPARLANPVKAPTRLVNTWNAPRDGGRRQHQGIDILAPRSTPVVSTTRGLVTRVGTNELGGHVVWVLGPGLESHYYAHLDRFADIQAGDIVNPGDVLGFVGRTGNARGTPFHLHYGIYRHGRAQNPYPRLIATQTNPGAVATARGRTGDWPPSLTRPGASELSCMPAACRRLGSARERHAWITHKSGTATVSSPLSRAEP